MDQVLADTLTANLKSAKSDEELHKAMKLAMIAMVDCQCKTANRVKELHGAKDRVAWLVRGLQGFAAGGGFALLAKALKMWGML